MIDLCSRFFLAITVASFAIAFLFNAAERQQRAYDIENQETLGYVMVQD